MTEPTSPKKQSLMPASRLRKALRAAGHHLSPVVQIGKEGATPAVAQALDAQLLAHAPRIHAAAAEGERRAAGRHAQAFDTRQRGGQLVGQALGEVDVGGVAADRLER